MKYAIIPAAGSGTRMKELGKNYAKTVLPYEGKPILIHIIESIISEVEPDEIIVVYGNEEHREQLQEVVRLYDLNVKFVPVIPIGRVGPAQSIASGIPWDVTESDSLFIHLSDFVVSDKSALHLAPDSISAFPVVDQHRWCMVKESKSGLEFFDKPKTHVDTDLAVAGLYHISDAKQFLFSYLYNTSGSQGESQISEVLSFYGKTHRLSIDKIKEDALKDFGTIEEFIQNRGISKTRCFNDISVKKHSVTKTSVDGRKMFAEHQWYSAIPDDLRRFVPMTYAFQNASREQRPGYSMERLKSTNLRDLYLYLDRSEESWNEVFDSVFDFIDVCKQESTSGSSFWEFLFDKNLSRIKGTAYQDEAVDFLESLHSMISNSRFFNETTVYHGDLHFANMFYCFHYKQLKVIDPNGRLMGHWFYDLAKLNHSVFGKYDWIDSELYHDSGFMDRGCAGVVDAFDGLLGKIGLDEGEIRLLNALTASLFLTMIPLHSHSPKNQELFLSEFRRIRDFTFIQR
jgi:dTDP-glucose pyrophosphorylase